MNGLTLGQYMTAINTGGVVAVLIIAIWLGLRGDVVPGDVLRECRMSRDAYLAQLLQYQIPVPPHP